MEGMGEKKKEVRKKNGSAILIESVYRVEVRILGQVPTPNFYLYTFSTDSRNSRRLLTGQRHAQKLLNFSAVTR